MFEAFLDNTAAEGLRPLGTAPQRSFELVQGTVASRLGAAHAALFAEPVSTQYGDRYDWYASVPGTAKRLTELDEAEQTEIREILKRLTDEIAVLAQEYLASDDRDDQRLGEALENALEVPSESFIHVVTGADGAVQPVLVNWAWIEDRQTTPQSVLRGVDTRPKVQPKAVPSAPPVTPVAAGAAPAAVVATPGVTPDRTPRPARYWWLWLGWLLLALMIGAILLLLLAPCALRLPGFGSFCPSPDSRMGVLTQERAQLDHQILLVERRIALADQACQPEIVAPIPIPATDTPGLPQVDERMQARGAQEGELTISLAWNSRADLDLHVICPAGLMIWYGGREACGGELDIDDNSKAETARTDPIESTFFTTPAPGIYTIEVEHFGGHGTIGSQPFRLRIQDGMQVTELEGAVSATDNRWTTTYTYEGN